NYNDSVSGVGFVTIYVDEWLEVLNSKLNPFDSPITERQLSVLTHNSKGKLYVTDGNAQSSWGKGGTSASPVANTPKPEATPKPTAAPRPSAAPDVGGTPAPTDAPIETGIPTDTPNVPAESYPGPQVTDVTAPPETASPPTEDLTTTERGE
ncbi:MAG: hypothetical protein LBC78_02265, partial [Oscillospiraceae bacterium]|nr:hypothetical protein [Oscillospiraceae bacterium]